METLYTTLFLLIIFSTIANGCQILHASTSVINYFTSHSTYNGYSSPYASNTNDCWIINGGSHYVQIFKDRFRIQFSSNCENDDYVEILDGSSPYSTRLGIFCGSYFTTTMSTGTSLYVKFRSDDRVNYNGFRLAYRAFSCTTLTASPLTSFSIISHPSFDGVSTRYSSNTLSCWTITVPSQYTDTSVVELTKSYFHLEYSTWCSDDFVEFLDGSGPGNASIGRYCSSGSDFEVIRSSGSYLTVIFSTDGSSVSTGFKLYYKVYQCETLSATANVQYLTSHAAYNGQTTTYQSNYYQCWVITVGNKYVIEANNEDFELDDVSCDYEYVEFRNGSTKSSPLIQNKACGSSPEFRTIRSTGTSLLIGFKSDNTTNSKKHGFQISYKAVDDNCTFLYAKNSTQYFRSHPGYSSYTTYPSNTDSCFIIVAHSSRSNDAVYLQQTSFSLQSCNTHGSWNRDNVTFYDGKTNNSSSIIGTYCGGGSSAAIQSTGNYMFIRFRTDDSLNYAGFIFSYKIYSRSDSSYDDYGDYTVTILVIIVVILVFIVVITCCVVCCCKKKDDCSTNGCPSVPFKQSSRRPVTAARQVIVHVHRAPQPIQEEERIMHALNQYLKSQNTTGIHREMPPVSGQ